MNDSVDISGRRIVSFVNFREDFILRLDLAGLAAQGADLRDPDVDFMVLVSAGQTEVSATRMARRCTPNLHMARDPLTGRPVLLVELAGHGFPPGHRLGVRVTVYDRTGLPGRHGDGPRKLARPVCVDTGIFITRGNTR